MNDFYNNCKTCIPQFSDHYWWQKSQHRKYFDRFLYISIVISLIGTLFLVQARNDQFLSELILDSNYTLKLIVVFVFLLFMQCLCFFLVRLLFYIHIKRSSRFVMLRIRMMGYVLIFYLLLPWCIKQLIVFITTHLQQVDVRGTGYLHHEYYHICIWMILYVSLWMFFFFSRENNRHQRSAERKRREARRLADKLLRHDLREYLEKGFMVIVKKDIVFLINTEGELSIKGRKNDGLSSALKLDYAQISKSVFIVKDEILAVAEDYIEISYKRREILENAIKKYKKLAVVAVEFKSEHGLLTLSPVYAEKIGKH